LKKTDDRAILRVVIFTGIASVVTQLLTIREFLSRFEGNEIVIALILFNWLILGGLGSLLARIATRRRGPPTAIRLGWLSLGLAALAPVQILAVRILGDAFFVYGSSVGFYPTWLFTFVIISPYCLLLGFVLPYSLFILRAASTDYPGSRVYIADNIGDMTGGALFAFALVYLTTPLPAILLAQLPLLAGVYFMFPARRRNQPAVIAGLVLVLLTLIAAAAAEKITLAPRTGKLAYYRETHYGRITVYQDRELFTLFEDGVPIFSSQNRNVAEETVHYPLSQLDHAQRVLLISLQAGVMAELQKYDLTAVDYVELDPEVSDAELRFGLLKRVAGLHILNQDARAYLSRTTARYDAIIVNLPEPTTFQVNRFYTRQFFQLAKANLTPGGVLSFSMQGFDNFLAPAQRRKLSVLYNTAKACFEHVLLLPGQKVYFLCRDRPLDTDIPGALTRKGIATVYISGFYYGNLTAERIRNLNDGLDGATPLNVDHAPFLMRLMFAQWFAKFQTSPRIFFLVFGLLLAIYLWRISAAEFVLFSTGCMTMGSEVLVIFAFQIYFGYIYLQIGIIVTVFLAGLLPGAWLGQRLHLRGRRVLAITDIVLIVLPLLFVTALAAFGERLPADLYLVFGFGVSVACGFQFPVALYLRGGGGAAAARTFSADLMGAACGTLVTSIVLIPYFGIIWAAAALAGIKLISLLVVKTAKK
jgi:spermidine synthase